jgi:signal transduction histidine kinase/ligand-binding sensor domain-containing protein
VKKTVAQRTGNLLLFLSSVSFYLAIATQCTLASAALDPNRLISQYAHTAWRMQDGFFSGSPNAIAQTTDGYLWIGTGSGLTRFDGVRFVAWTPPDQSRLPSLKVVSLLADRDGSLWVGLEAGLVRVKGQKWSTYPAVHARVNSIVQDDEGTIWVAQTRILDGSKPFCQVTDTGTRCYGEAEGVTIPGGDSLVLDERGNFWIGGDTGLLEWKPGSSSLYPLNQLKGFQELDGISALAGARDGSLWVGIGESGTGIGLLRFIQGAWKPFITPELNGNALNVQALYVDRENNLWVGTAKQGLYRISESKVDHFGSADGLSSDDIYNFHEDREGNLWVATSRGLDNFRNTRVVNFSTREGLSADEVNSVLATRDGSVWIGSSEGLDVLHPSHLSAVSAMKAAARKQITSLFEGRAGGLWIGVMESMLFCNEGRVREIRRPDGTSLGLVTGITEDSENNIWVEVIGPPRTLIRIRDFKVQEMFPAPQMPAARKLAADPKRGIWLGLISGDLARYRDGKLDLFSYKHSSRVDQVLVGPDGSVLGATSSGLIAWRNGKQQTLTVRNGLPCNAINAIIWNPQNTLWLYTQCGLIEVQGAELERWWNRPDVVMRIRTFETSDGIQPGDALFNSSARSTDGRLWFPNGVVLQMINPAKLGGNDLPPPVHIEEVNADRRSYPVQTDLRLPALTRDLEIRYTALSFVAPANVQFRYKLDGYERDWQNAETRRQAFYSNLPPGTYRFHVIASNNDGIWNENGAALTFVIVPAFYQTVWFRLLLGLVLIGLLWLFHALRLRQATSHIHARLAERLEERGRIARELHDTLIQSVDGLMLRIQTALSESDTKRSRLMIEKALDSADEVMLEGRQRVHALRAEATTVNELSEALASYGRDLAEDHPAEFSVALVGSPKPISAFVRDEAYRIGREALGNAFQHAGATKIEVEVTYDRAVVHMRVRDNGRGIDEHTLNGGRPGHWGLRGMRERATAIGGKLVIWSRPGVGTEIDLEIPANAAYKTVLRGLRSHWKKSGWTMEE